MGEKTQVFLTEEFQIYEEILSPEGRAYSTPPFECVMELVNIGERGK